MPRGARAPVEDYLKTPEFKKFQKTLQRKMAIQRMLESGFLQKIAAAEPFKRALGVNQESIQRMIQQMPKPVEELHQQPDAMDFERTQVTY